MVFFVEKDTHVPIKNPQHVANLECTFMNIYENPVLDFLNSMCENTTTDLIYSVFAEGAVDL